MRVSGCEPPSSLPKPVSFLNRYDWTVVAIAPSAHAHDRSGGQRRSSSVGGRSPTTNSILVRRLSSFGPALGGVIKYRFVERTQSRHLPSQKSPFQVGLLCCSGSDWECLPVSCHLMSSCSPAIARHNTSLSDTRDRLWAQRLCTPRIRWGFRPRCWGPCLPDLARLCLLLSPF